MKKIFFTQIIFALAVIISFASLVLEPRQAADAAREAVSLCLDVIIPSLFPFFVLSTLTVELGLTRFIGRALEGIMRPVFGLSGECSAAVTLGFIGGYPVGARTAIALYSTGRCTKTETERLLSFCNNSGPAFILGAVGAGIFSNSAVGWLLYLAHVASSLTVGFFFRFYGGKAAKSKPRRAKNGEIRFTAAFTKSVAAAANAIINVCAFVIFFAVAIRMLRAFGALTAIADAVGGLLYPLGIERGIAERLLTGLIEVTSGLWSLSTVPGEVTQKLAVAAFMLGWAGISVHCQVLSFIADTGLKTWPYILGKVLHGVFSSVYILLLLTVFDVKLPVSSFLVSQVEGILNFGVTRGVTLGLSLLLCAGAVIIAAIRNNNNIRL